MLFNLNNFGGDRLLRQKVINSQGNVSDWEEVVFPVVQCNSGTMSCRVGEKPNRHY